MVNLACLNSKLFIRSFSCMAILRIILWALFLSSYPCSTFSLCVSIHKSSIWRWLKRVIWSVLTLAIGTGGLCELISLAGRVTARVQTSTEASGSGQEIQLAGRDCSQGSVAFQELLWALGTWLIKMCTWRTVFFWGAVSTWSLLDTLINCGAACFVYHLF